MKPTFDDYQKSQAPRNGIRFPIYEVLIALEKVNPVKGQPTFTRLDNGDYFIDYMGTCAEFPQRTFPNKREAQKYCDELKRHFVQKHGLKA